MDNKRNIRKNKIWCNKGDDLDVLSTKREGTKQKKKRRGGNTHKNYLIWTINLICLHMLINKVFL